QAGWVDAETRIPVAVREALASRGHQVHANHPWGGVSLVCAITADAATGVLAGGADPRGDCYAARWGEGPGPQAAGPRAQGPGPPPPADRGRPGTWERDLGREGRHLLEEGAVDAGDVRQGRQALQDGPPAGLVRAPHDQPLPEAAAYSPPRPPL